MSTGNVSRRFAQSLRWARGKATAKTKHIMPALVLSTMNAGFEPTETAELNVEAAAGTGGVKGVLLSKQDKLRATKALGEAQP